MPELTHLPPQSTFTSPDQPVDIMVNMVAGLIGGQDSLEDRSRAILWLDRAADWMNGAGIYLYRRKTQSYTSAAGDFATGDKTLTPPTDWAWPSDGCKTLFGGATKNHLEWLDYHIFQQVKDKDSNGSPQYLSIRSEMDDQIHLLPNIDTAVIDQIDLQYVARLQRPSENATMLISPEVREALICGGEAFALRLRYASKPGIWMPVWKQFERAMEQARIAAWRYRGAVHTNARPDEAGFIGPGGGNNSPSLVLF